MAKSTEHFALTNPITKLTGKQREDLTREDLVKVILDNQLERITFHYIALDGKLKELRIPVIDKDQVELILTEGERVDGSSIFKGIVDPSKSDLYVVPAYRTAFFNPFDEQSIDFICRFFTAEGKLAEFTPDNVLHNAAASLKEKTGLEFYAHSELEFYLIKEPENYLYPPEKQKGYHASGPFVKSTDVVNEMMSTITKIIGHVKYAHNEVGCFENIQSDYLELAGKSAEQVEIEFLLMPVQDCGDSVPLAKWIIRNIAYKYGYVATFVPKIENGQAGSGMHFHTALMKNGNNIMVNKKGELSEEAHKLIGGLCLYAPSLTAFGNMVSASYLRLVPHQEAPTKVCWSECNRSAMIRVPLGWTNVSNLCQQINPQQKTKYTYTQSRQTVELRSPDGSAFVHFLLAGMTMAAEWGLTNEKESLKLADQCHVIVNIHEQNTEGLVDLPASCCESADLLLKEKDLYLKNNIFNERTLNTIASILQKENDRTLNDDLMKLPDQEKIEAARIIMHRDIHKQ